ncbi:hypothetical protein H072_6846 [Dactylellina haptotyla CBS 200.50]|uniref:Uncharacterized protein n=1 Tax=Dactylellina haptotyla (strain CBS 200.50) TaxID=1284197 RepID=S8BJB0_DACHA|nr:hypothetical protein H072_6846 [Dactylellina haptotyla CBS 200.50]
MAANKVDGLNLFDLPYELQYQILSLLLDVTVNFVFKSPIQKPELSKEEKNLPCIVSIYIPDSKYVASPPYLCVSHLFTKQILAVSQDFCQRLQIKLSRCLTDDQKIDPEKITPEFLDYVYSGRLVFAAVPSHNTATFKSIPRAIRDATRWVYFTKTNSVCSNHHNPRKPRGGLPERCYNSTGGRKHPCPAKMFRSALSVFIKRFPRITKLTIAEIHESDRHRGWQGSLGTFYSTVRYGRFGNLEIVFEDSMDSQDSNSSDLDIVGTRCLDWASLSDECSYSGSDGKGYLWIPWEQDQTNPGPRSPDDKMNGKLFRLNKLKTWELQQRGRYTRSNVSDTTQQVDVLEEAVVWSIRDIVSQRRMAKYMAAGFKLVDNRYQCSCQDCNTRRREGKEVHPQITYLD